MATFSEIKSGLDAIATRTARNQKLIDRAREALVQADADLTAMQSEYSGFAGEIDDALAANPSEDAYIVAASEKDQLVADFQAMKMHVAALIAAYDAV